MGKIFTLWVYLQTTPLLGLCATLLAWRGAVWLGPKLGGGALTNPMLLSVVALASLLLATGTPYSAYFEGAQYVHFLLGPATVALALPMYANRARIRASARAILPALLAGSVVASLSAMLIARALGASPVVVLSLARHIRSCDAHSDADIRLLERGRVIDAVAGHGRQKSLRLKQLHNTELFLRHGSGKKDILLENL